MYTLTTPQELSAQLAARMRALRLSQDLSQASLARKAGVSLGSLRRFEREGLASLELVLSVTIALGRHDEIEGLFLPTQPKTIAEMDQLEAKPKRKRGRR